MSTAASVRRGNIGKKSVINTPVTALLDSQIIAIAVRMRLIRAMISRRTIKRIIPAIIPITSQVTPSEK